MFVDTLQPPFDEPMVGSVSSNFVDIIIIGKRIGIGLKRRKIAHGLSEEATAKKPSFNLWKKKEGEAHATSVMPFVENHAPPWYKQSYQQHANQCIQEGWIIKKKWLYIIV